MSNIYSNQTDEWLVTKIEQLQELLVSGASSVSYNGVTTTYTKPENMRTELSELKSLLSSRMIKKVANAKRRSALSVQYPKLPAGKGYFNNVNSEDPFSV